MDGIASAWLERTIGPLRAGRRVLVLCRTRPTVALVRRWAARRGGVLGLEAATPTGLAQQVLQPSLFDSSARPPAVLDPSARPPAVLDPSARPPAVLVPAHALPPADTEIGARIALRPGLAALLRRWAQHVRGARHAGRAPAVPPWLEELLATGWGADEADATLQAFVEAALARGRRLHAGASWDRVVAIGFDLEEEAQAPWEPVLAKALAGHVPALPPERTEPLPALRVPDVVAEARLAARLAAADPHGTLVLVSDTTTARRVRDTLARSGIPCAWRDTEALSVHELASAVRRAAAWFSEVSATPSDGGADPPLQVADLAFVLARTSLGRKLHPAADAAIRKAAASRGLEPLERLSRRGLVDVLDRARLLDAPLSTWLRRLAVLSDRAEDRDEQRAGAIAVRVRLLVLSAALEARPIEAVLEEDAGEPLSFEVDDFEAALAELLGDGVDPVLPAGDRLGAVKRFLVDCRIRFGDDPGARAILAALRDRHDWPAGPAHVHQALSGALDPGVLSDGVDVLLAEDWDGRPCRTLVLLDVHDHGLGRRGSPDPLLTDAEIAGLGALPPRDAVHHRLRQVRRAAGLAERTVAIVTRRDAGGRDVVPPVLLDLLLEDDHTSGSHGLLLDLPELAPIRVLEGVTGGLPEAPIHPSWEVRHLAAQATAEWYRDGRGPRMAPAVEPVSHPLPLADVLARERPIAPHWVLPYLGHAEGVPEARLPAGPSGGAAARFSVTRLLQPLARCPWQAFARVVLDVKEARDVAEDLDPREVGEVVHTALERTSAALRWRMSDDGDAERIVASLREATTETFRATIEAIGALSPARVASVDGRRDRWNTHWQGYVRSRLRPTFLKEWPKAYQDHPDVLLAEDHVRAAMPATAKLPWWMVRAWIVNQARPDGADRAVSPDLLLEVDPGRSRLPEACLPDVVAVLDHALLRQAGRAVVDGARSRWVVQDAGVVSSAVAAEIPFGEQDAAAVPVAGLDGFPRREGSALPGLHPEFTLALPAAVLRLGSADLELRGKIDRVEWVRTRDGAGAVVVDYKTGGAELDGNRFQREQLELRDPQLLVYAMVLERARREGQLPEPLAGIPVAAVAHDRVQHTLSAAVDPKPEAPDTWLPIEPRLLRWAAAKLGQQVDDARAGTWTLRPRAETCPQLVSYGHDHCPYGPACRLRGLP